MLLQQPSHKHHFSWNWFVYMYSMVGLISCISFASNKYTNSKKKKKFSWCSNQGEITSQHNSSSFVKVVTNGLKMFNTLPDAANRSCDGGACWGDASRTGAGVANGLEAARGAGWWAEARGAACAAGWCEGEAVAISFNRACCFRRESKQNLPLNQKAHYNLPSRRNIQGVYKWGKRQEHAQNEDG